MQRILALSMIVLLALAGPLGATPASGCGSSPDQMEMHMDHGQDLQAPQAPVDCCGETGCDMRLCLAGAVLPSPACQTLITATGSPSPVAGIVTPLVRGYTVFRPPISA